MKTATLAILGMLVVAPFAAASGSVAQEAACSIAGTYAFPDLPPSRNNIVPSVQKQFAAIGLQAKQAGCDIAVTCAYQAGAGATARDRSNSQCTSASILITMYETRGTVRSRLRSEMTVENLRRPDMTSLTPGTVYVTLR
ncbi:hypothetical protein [Devosia chinhatensis]|uniref:Uncharacterized protein n=1 Tax=Devosia chinhatensis TaxID=429727 RepID=A0A0F5FMI9_9HYPH|nr:hypothetical protein [Devosia chinhatensis]KKB09790.1 hypothetical protein VE26_08015 [Devosia chinhatensis]